MMSEFLERIWKSLCFRRHGSARKRTRPYLLLGREVVGDSSCGGKVLNLKMYDPMKQEEVKLEKQIVSKEVHKSWRIGSSRGWLVLCNKNDFTVRLTNIFNPSKKKIISLPPLIMDRHKEHIVNVSVSVSSSKEEEDCEITVAIKFYGSRLNLCRPGDSEWTRIDMPCPSFHSSLVMYSKRDKRFYVNSCNPYYKGPTDFTPKSGSLITPVSGYIVLLFCNIPHWDFPTPFRIQQHLVESPSGQTFAVLWFIKRVTNNGEIVPLEDTLNSYDSKNDEIMTHKIIVFRQDKKKVNGTNYTDDIGDLCIFVGDNEPFCLSATNYSGLKPNSVYFAGLCSGYGICDLSSQTITYLSHSTPSASMFWLPEEILI